ncbi:fatty acyl-AMP ligase [Neptuniibacter sp. QD37_6]|uniref:fatty acyl-AMP ligase n=1 Tax=Neptuniibacter sp. QD37_6 TaxID=3398210 RepID=UPI0039F49E5C
MFHKSEMSVNELFSATASLPVHDALAIRAWAHPDKVLFTFLDEQGEVSGTLSYRELYLKSLSIAQQLKQHSEAGDRVILFFPQSLEFIASFIACLMTQRIAVPLNLPNRRRLDRCEKIITDSGATLALSHSSCLEESQAAFANSEQINLNWLVPTDTLAPTDLGDQTNLSNIDPQSVAFLQYTSGSTSDPKGVMVSHHNITTNLRMMRDSWQLDHTTDIVSWQPHHHDMGLILGQLLPMVLGNHTVLMAPNTFVRQPSIWLQAISDYQATMAGGPNFAYNLAVDRYSADKYKDLDLSSWTIALNGADVVRATSLSRFVDNFAKHGFEADSFLPCYGLAEATLFVSGGPVRKPTCSQEVDTWQMEIERRIVPPSTEEKSRLLVGSGEASWEVETCIVNPDTCERCATGEVGEIWLHGEAMAQGYWQNEVATQNAFRAEILGEPGKHFMRTGDLGFIGEDDLQLYISGRLKDLIICEGRNLHPEDVEYSIIESFPENKPQSGAVFCHDDDQNRQCIVAAVEINREIKRALKENPKQVKASIRASVAQEHGITLNQIIFVQPTSMHKTTSGKIQRSLMRKLYLANELSLVTE